MAQVIDDLPLLYRMLADQRAAAPIYQPTHYWAAYEAPVIERLRGGLHDFRGRADPVLATFGANDEPPAMLRFIQGVPDGHGETVHGLVTSLNRALTDGDRVLPYGLRMVDVFELAYSYCRERARRSPAIVSIDALNVSNIGAPFGFEREGCFLTNSALYYYLRYAFVAEHVDLRTVDVVVELGSGSGKQVEVLKRLHPHLTVVLVDLAPQLYVAERFLTAVFPDDVVSYDDTRGSGPLALEPGKIHFAGSSRIEDIEARERLLFWNAASFGEMEPHVVEHYAKVVSPIAEWVYLCQCFSGKERAEEVCTGGVLEATEWHHYVNAFGEHEPIARRPAHTGYVPLVEGRCAYDDTFWVRRSAS